MNAILWNSRARRWLFVVLWLLLAGVLAHGSGLRINPTPSLPKGIYRLAAEHGFADLAKGDLVSFCLQGEFVELAKERGYLQAGSCPNGLRPLLKRLAGLPGDHIEAGSLDIRSEDNQGRPMSSVLASGVIPTAWPWCWPIMKAVSTAAISDSFRWKLSSGSIPFLCSPPTIQRNSTMTHKEYLAAAARAAAQQITDDPGLYIPLDPDVAEHLGAFQEDAIILADLIEDALLTINGQGEALYEER